MNQPKSFFKKFSSIKIIGLTLAIANIALNEVKVLAIENQSSDQVLQQIDDYNQENETQQQVTSVSQLRDVSPTDWAYEALRSLVERYGCIVGYPDRTFRGNRALSRYEFAAGLNACMQQMERLIAQSEAVLKEDIETLKRLMTEFETELTALGAKVDNLESRVSFLEDHQFSTTTKLTGEVVFGLSSIFGGEKNQGEEEIEQIPILGNRTRLELNTSFTGKDTLYTRLATGNIPDYITTTGTNQATLSFAQPDDNQVFVEVLNYNFPLTENITVWLEGKGGAFDDFTNTLSANDGDGGSGAISVFGTRNLIYYQGEGAGLGVEGKMGSFDWSIGYLAENASNPKEGEGLLNGAYGILGQIGFNPNENIGFSFSYGHGYNTSAIGNNSREFTDILSELDGINTIHNTYAVTSSFKLTDHFTLGAWGGYSNVATLNTFANDDIQVSRGSSDFWYWAVSATFPDLFKEGNMAGLVLGMQPWQTNSTITTNDSGIKKDDQSFHIEAFYQYALNDNISITPGVIIITNPSNDDRNSTLIIGALRTTFTF